MFGVYYHLEDHLEVFRNIYEKSNEQVIFSGHVLNSSKKICKINLDGLFNMTASYTIASIPYLLDICKRCGFKKTELVGLRMDGIKYKLGWHVFKRGSAVFRAYK